MAKSTRTCVRLTVILYVYAAVTAARVLPSFEIYDTSKYGILQLGNGLAQTPQMG